MEGPAARVQTTFLLIVRRTMLLLCALTLANCSRAASSLPAVAPQTESAVTPDATFKQLYRFKGAPSGSGPTGILADKGAIYGTTTGGGSKTLGTFFVRSASGAVKVLYSFRGGNDGSEPDGTLIALDGTFYGTTQYGGPSGDGTVFAVTPAGKEHVVYSFKGGTDGAEPLLAGLVAVNGSLYGTTNAGGEPSCKHGDIVGCGIVFELSKGGKERVLHRFKNKPDGACPSGSLLVVGTKIYGTTNFGGKYGNGSVFSVTTAGRERVFYSFGGYPDGSMPFAGLTEVNGSLYGTTTLGGAYEGAGTVFELTGSGTEHVLHSFHGTPDGALPYAALTADGGTLYGTTELGGNGQKSCVGRGLVGCGTVFSITTGGDYNVLYRFTGGSDGSDPLASLVSETNGYYGTTLSGGTNNRGTIFEVMP
jgi:uncharacterized repeat protein (TIGR03803 family)